MHLPLLLVGVGAMSLTFFGQSFLSHFSLMLPSLSQVFQQLRLLTLEGDRGRIYSQFDLRAATFLSIDQCDLTLTI